MEPWKWNAQAHIPPHPHRQNRGAEPVFPPPAGRREDDIHPGRVTDVVRTSTTAPETEREREREPAESRIDSGCPARPAAVLHCSSTGKRHSESEAFYPPGLPTRSVIFRALKAHPIRYDGWGTHRRIGPRHGTSPCASVRELRAPSSISIPVLGGSGQQAMRASQPASQVA